MQRAMTDVDSREFVLNQKGVRWIDGRKCTKSTSLENSEAALIRNLLCIMLLDV